MEKFAIDVRIVSGKFLVFQDAFYTHSFPSNHVPYTRPPKKNDVFAKFKPDPQLFPVPGMALLESVKSDGDSGNNVSVIPISHGFVGGINKFCAFVNQLAKLVETLSALSWMNQQLQDLKKQSLV